MKIEKCFSAEHMEALAKILADTNNGLTGSEIGYILLKCGIEDVDSNATKWKRLYNAFACYQSKHKKGNHIIGFIHKALNPVRFTGERGRFDDFCERLNIVLAFSGLHLGEDGKIRRCQLASTITEAEQRAKALKETLLSRNVHKDVLRFCRAELLQDNYFHAVLEASKSVANKLRLKTGLSSDGKALAENALSLGQSGRPLLAINSLKSDTERAEQTGFMNLVVGLFGTFRNPTAHAEKIYWPIEEQDALDILSLVSLVHRKLDKATKLS